MKTSLRVNESGSMSPEFSLSPTKSITTERADILKHLHPIEKTTDQTANPEKIDMQCLSSSLNSKLVSLPKFNDVSNPLPTPYELLQEWEGYVQTVGSNEFTASLIDWTQQRKTADEEADFSIDDLTEEDKKLLKPGAVFRWLIGYRSIGGTKERFSKIVFRRLPQWTERELRESQEKAKNIANAITWE